MPYDTSYITNPPSDVGPLGKAPTPPPGTPDAPAKRYDTSYITEPGAAPQDAAESAFISYGHFKPQDAARTRRVAKQVGLPETIVEGYEDTFEDMLRREYQNNLMKTAPITRTLIAKDPKLAAILADDLGNMTRIETIFKEQGFRAAAEELQKANDRISELYRQMPKGEVTKGPEAGFFEPVTSGYSAGKAALTLSAVTAGLFSSDEAGLQRLAKLGREAEVPVPENVQRGMQQIVSADNALDALIAIGGNPSAVSYTVLHSLGAMAGVLPAQAIGLVAGKNELARRILTGTGAGVGSGLVEYGMSLRETLEEAGVNLKDARALRDALNNPALMSKATERAAGRGLAIGAVDAISAGFAGVLLASANRTAGSVLARTAGEMALQGAAGGTGEALAQAVVGDEFSWGEVLMEAVAEIPTGVIDIPMNLYALDREARAADVREKELTELFTAAADTIARGNVDPETFSQLMGDLTEGATVFLEEEKLTTVMIEAGVPPEAIPSLAAQTGQPGELEIPAAELVTALAGTGAEAAIIPYIRTDPTQPTIAEAREDAGRAFELFQEAGKRAMAKHAEQTQFQTALDTVKEEIKADLDQLQLRKVGPGAKEDYVKFAGHIYATLADRLNVTPLQARDGWVDPNGKEHRGYKLRVLGEDTEARARIPATLEDFTPGRVGNILQRDNWAIVTAENPQGKTLTPEENAQRQAALKAELDKQGIKYEQIEGKYVEEGQEETAPLEHPFLLTDIDLQRARALGKMFDQDSIISRHGLVYHDGTVQRAKRVTEHKTEPKNYWSRVPSTGALFTADLDFDARVPLDDVLGQSVSTRMPSPKAGRADPHLSTGLDVDLAEAMKYPGYVDKLAAHFKGILGIKTKARKSETVLEAAITHMHDNLLWLFDQVPVEIQARSKKWYEGGRVLAERLAFTYGYTDVQASAVIAVNSPQTPWDTNMSRAERILDIWTYRQNTAWSTEMDATLARLFDGDAEIQAKLKGKTLAELDNTALQAMWIRVYDESHNDKHYRLVTPEGGFGDWYKTGKGARAAFTWASYLHISKSIAILKDGSIENVSRQLGEEHKVRNFYNNLFDPFDARSVTIDTHAVAASLLRPLSGNDREVLANLGGAPSHDPSGHSGTYVVYAEAYRRAAEARGVLPREMQSVTWEALRSLYPDTFKSAEKKAEGLGTIDTIWTDYEKGDINADEARARILNERGGNIPSPRWVGTVSGLAEGSWASSYTGELLDSDWNGRAAVVGRGDVFAQGAARITGTITVDGIERQVVNSKGQPLAQTDEGLRNFWRWFGDSKVVDEQGRPLVVYHGTAGDFAEFDVARAGGNYPTTGGRRGFFFTSSPITAGVYAEQPAYAYLNPERPEAVEFGEGTANVMPVYLKIAAPLESKTKQSPDKYFDYRREDMYSRAEKKGADGLVVHGTGDYRRNLYVAFEPTQIKSAVGNAGTFDPADPNVLHQGRLTTPPVNEDGTITLYHYSDKGGVAELDPAYFGKGIPGAERKRAQADPDNWVPRTSYGIALGRPGGYVKEQGLGPNLYEVRVPADKMYDFQRDPDGLRPKSVTGWDNPTSVYEKAIRDAGYTGFWTQHPSLGLVGVSFDKQTAAPSSGIPVPFTGRVFRGEPRKRYKGHATKQANGIGTYYSSDRRVAEIYTVDPYSMEKEGRVTEATITLNNPYRHSGHILDQGAGVAEAQALTDRLIALGHDGVIIDHGPGATEYVVFDKSVLRQDQGGQADRLGTFNPKTLDMRLLAEADLSTFEHEVFHFLLTVYTDIAAQPDAPADIVKDVQALMDWFGIENVHVWNAMSLEQQRPYHEQFAETGEQYLFTGKAPTAELQSLFRTFAKFLSKVYGTIKDFLRSDRGANAKLNPEIATVMDRMLATEKQIAQAEEQREYQNIFKTAVEAGMTPEQFARYQALPAEARAEAEEALRVRSLRDMKWMQNRRNKVIAELQKTAKEERAALRAEVAKEVAERPVFRAMRFLKKGETTDATTGEDIVATAGNKLAIPALEEMFPEGAIEGAPDWRSLGYGKYGMLANEGMHPDVAAEIFGFRSGHELVAELIAAPKFNDEVEGITDQRMLEQHSELATPEGLARAADEAIHNDVRAKVLATELSFLNKAIGAPTVLLKAAKDYARAMLAEKKVKALKPWSFSAMEVREGKLALKAMAKGDREAAAEHKRKELLYHVAVRAASEAVDEVKKAEKFIKKFDAADIRKRVDPDAMDQIETLLERFGFREKRVPSETRTPVPAVAAWADALMEDGYGPELSDYIRDEKNAADYRTLSLAKFRDVMDAIKLIDHIGRAQNNLFTAAKQRSYQAARDEIVADLEANAGARQANVRSATTKAGRAGEFGKKFWWAHRKVAMITRMMGGGKDGSPLWEYLIRPANAASDWETARRAVATEELTRILKPLFSFGRIHSTRQFFPGIDRSLTLEERFVIALNTGNAGNLQRLLGGENWTQAQIKPVLDSLTEEQWNAVQGVWDYLDSFRPEIGAKGRRVYGKEPDWVDATPVSVRTSDGVDMTLRGGYYPIKYDTRANAQAEKNGLAEEAKRQLQGAYTSATTRRSFTKSRVTEVHDRPLLYSLSGMYSGVNDVIHDLAWHEWLIDANRLMRSRSIDASIRQHYGPDTVAQFKSWIRDNAEGEQAAHDAGEAALSRMRQGISAAGLGYNLISALMQPFGVTQSAVRVGYKWVGTAIARYIAHPIDQTRESVAKSSFMANRNRTRLRELNELRNKVEGKSVTLDAVQGNAYSLLMRLQQIADTITWQAALEKAMSADPSDEARAIALADQAVIDSQGGGAVKDLSAIERGGPAFKLFTVFYSFMNTALNLNANIISSPDSRARKAVDLLMINVIPVILIYSMKEALRAGPDDDDDWDWEKLAKRLVAEEIDFLMGQMVIVRELAEAVKTLLGANDLGRDYKGPAGIRVVADAIVFSKQAHQGEFDTAFRKSAINLIGDMSGLPAAQINRSISGWEAYSEGETDDPLAPVFGYVRQ